MIPRGRGRGFNPSNRGGRNIIQYGSSRGITQNYASSSTGFRQNDPIYEEFMQFLSNRQSGDNNTPSYSQAAEENDDSAEYIESLNKEIIMILEHNDVMRYFEDNSNAWNVMNRYLDTASYTACSYKNRMYYENVLKSTGSCEILHYSPANNTNVYNFSKIIIKKIISPEEWGLSTLKEKEFFHQQQKISVKFNYWDYVEGFNKVFLYQNARKKHSWFIKVCNQVYNHPKPNWFINWWKFHGPSVQILPEPLKGLYSEWSIVSPNLKNDLCKNACVEEMPSYHFFIEFSIPWIFKWEPIVDYTPKNLPTLQRVYFTKFWMNMLRKDAEGEYTCKDTIEYIQKALKNYKDQLAFRRPKSNLSPYQLVEENLKASGKINPTKEEIVEAYLAQMKEDLVRNLDYQESDASMKTISDEDDNQFQCLAGESQQPEDVSIDDIFSNIRDNISRNLKGKDKEESSSNK